MEFYPKLGGLGYILLILFAVQKKNGANIHPPADISPVRASMHRKDRRGGDRIQFSIILPQNLAAV
jgi:hypothetical protein